MDYDIRNVGYEYLLAEQCLKDQDYEGAILHYKAAIANYEYADNEYILSPDKEYTMREPEGETHYPSPSFMRDDAECKISSLKQKMHQSESEIGHQHTKDAEEFPAEEERKELIFSGKWCHYCNCETKLVDSKDIYKNGVSYGYMYICPQCGAYVGCYRYTKRSFGSVANESLRLLRHRGHHYFDQLWKRRIIHRPGAYQWLSKEIGTDLDHTHFGMFNEEQCRKAIAYSMKILAERRPYIYAYDEQDFKYINEHFSPVYAVMGSEQPKRGLLPVLKDFLFNLTSKMEL